MSLRFGILGLLTEEPLHGYEVKSRFETMLGGAWEVNIGQIYSTMQRLERDGLIAPAGDRGDRGKQAYRLTEPGQQELADWLSQPESGPQLLHDDLFVKLLLMRSLANGNLDALLKSQRRMQLQHLRDLAVLERQARAENRPDLLLIIRGATLHAEADIKWLDECLADLHTLRPPDGGGH